MQIPANIPTEVAVLLAIFIASIPLLTVIINYRNNRRVDMVSTQHLYYEKLSQRQDVLEEKVEGLNTTNNALIMEKAQSLQQIALLQSAQIQDQRDIKRLQEQVSELVGERKKIEKEKERLEQEIDRLRVVVERRDLYIQELEQRVHDLERQ